MHVELCRRDVNLLSDILADYLDLTAIYNNELIQEPHRREEIVSNIEKQKDNPLLNIFEG